jgi:diguanylate cyclase (GGDEF)-like protein
LRFAIFTALGLALAGAVIVAILRQTDTVRAERDAIDRSRFVTEAVLSRELRAKDLIGPVQPARQRELDQLFVVMVGPEKMVRGTIYDSAGRATYSTDHGLIGSAASSPPFVREALAGTAVAHVETSGSLRLLSTYVPVVLGPQRTQGVVVLAQDYAPITAAARHSSLVVAGVLEGLLLLLFLILVPVLGRASARIRGHVGELDRIATHDELTGMYNRLGFRRAVEERISNSADESVALLLVDLDNFHEINDTVGSDSGDVLLKQVAERLSTEAADCDLVARLGEDEFGLALSNSSREDVVRAAKRVRELLAEPFPVHGVRVGIDARMGAALRPEHGTDFDTILRCAGVALSAAKASGDVEIYDPAHDSRNVARLELTSDLREALGAGQLVVHYQPQADLATRGVRAVEALLRWQHPQHGLLVAGDFVPLAEGSGLIAALGRFVLETAARQWQQWSAMGIRLGLSVNLAAVDMLDVSLPDDVAAMLERYGLPPEYLVLEITERSLLRDEQRVSEVLERLDRIGVRLAIDDFGTGYSSLSYLRRLPVRQVKVDKSFIAGIPGDASAETIVRATVLLAHTLKATVVAEGVETPAQWKRAAELGCDIAQGLLIGDAVSAEELTGMLDRPAPLVVAA